MYSYCVFGSKANRFFLELLHRTDRVLEGVLSLAGVARRVSTQAVAVLAGFVCLFLELAWGGMNI